MAKALGRGWIGAVALVAGCFSSNEQPGEDGNRPDDVPGITAQPSALLFHVEDCADLLGRIQDDIVARVDAQAEILKLGPQYDPYGYARGGGVIGGLPTTGPVAEGDFANAGGAGAPVPSAPPAAMDPSSAPVDNGTGTSTGGTGGSGGTGGGVITPGATAGTGGSSAPTDYSETNVQVAGVDEADIVKTDGERVYVIHGNDLFILDSWPAAESSVETQVELEGQALEMFVDGDRIVVFSTVWDQGDLIPPREPVMGADPALVGAPYDYYYYGAAFTKVTVIGAAPGALPSVERELFLEGSYLSARRHGDTVRAVIQGGFHAPPSELFYANISYVDPFGREYAQEEIDAQVDAWRERMIAAIRQTELADWLPTERERKDGVLGEPLRRCTDFYAPPPGLADYGLTNVVSFDLTDSSSPLGGAIVLGASDEVYANTEVMLLAHRDWRFDARLLDHERTVLHRFVLSPEATTYTASGVVPGHIVDQFSLDDRNGVVRVTTTQNIWNDLPPELPIAALLGDDEELSSDRTMTDNRVLTYEVRDSELVRVGASVPLGEDGERIMSTRFVDDMAYVVTFRQTDPLMAVDLADASAPTLLGELHIPGFSEYMHPLGDGHLLTIGRNTDASGFDIGLLLQIFDVTDPTNPIQAHTFAYGPDGYSEANQNHKAFTFHRPAGYAPDEGLLAFPFVSYGYPFRSTLEVFDVSAAGGFSQLGSVDHTAILTQACTYANPVGDVWINDIYYYCQEPEVRRGLFIFDDTEDASYVYSVSYGGMLVHDLDDMSTPVATVPLPAPDYTERRGSYATGGGTAGSGATTTMTDPAQVEPVPTPAPLPASSF